MNFKKILNILIFLAIFFNMFLCCSSYAVSDIEVKKKQTREKINHLKWLESLETNKLYKNQQKLENATTHLTNSKKEIISAQNDLNNLQAKLGRASADYNNLNYVLATHIRSIYKSQRNVFLEAFLSAEDINMLVDRIYYQKILLKDDYNKMKMAERKALEIATIKYSIESKKRSLIRNVASINYQQKYIQKAIEKNSNMIEKLRTNRYAYQRAEKELERQSASIGSYINKTTARDKDIHVASGFVKPISGNITSPFGYRVHPIFNSRSFHSGIDIGGPNYGAIKASNTGKVIYSGWYGGYGKVVILEHGIINGKPVTTLYAHMSSISVAKGARVTKGQVLGYEGTTGYSTGPHCHFEVRVNGQPNNPLRYIR